MEMAGMAGLVGAAAAGQFAVDEASGEQMIFSIRQMRTQLNMVMLNLRRMTVEQTALGTLPEALHVAHQNELVLSGDQQSAAYVLAKFAEALEHAETAVRQGMANYSEVEAAAERSFQQWEAQQHDRAGGHRPGGMRAV